MKNRGFTLLELMVAVAVTLVLAGIMLTVTTESMTLWRRSQAKSSAAIQAKVVLDQLERDLHSAVLRDDGRMWLSVNIDNDQGPLVARGWLFQAGASLKPTEQSLKLLPVTEPGSSGPVISKARFGLSGVWLRLIASNIDDNGSQPVAISYQLNRRPLTGLSDATNLAETRYLLLREEIDPAATFSTVIPALFSDKNNPASLVAPATKDTIAVNVVDFGIWLFRRGAKNELIPIFPSTATTPLSYSGPQTALAPAVAEVMIRVLTDDGAAKLVAMETGLVSRPAQFASDPAGWWWSIVEANSQVFTRRIELKAGTL